MEKLDYKNENIERKYSEIMQNIQFVKVKNGLLKLGKYFQEMKDKELKDRER